MEGAVRVLERKVIQERMRNKKVEEKQRKRQREMLKVCNTKIHTMVGHKVST
jgi:hypothetical protein